MSAILTVDLGFGDAGKGSVVDYLTRVTEAHTVVRYNGGPQAAHRVCEKDRDHIFAQFGSGTFAGARTYLSRYVLINPLNLETEAEHLREVGVPNPYDLLDVHEDCLVITPFHVAANRCKERQLGRFRHGSCGQGVGACFEDFIQWPPYAVKAKDLKDLPILRRKMKACWERFTDFANLVAEDKPRELTDPDAPNVAAAAYYEAGRRINLVDDDFLGTLREEQLVFEGAQGVLLDEVYGFHPYTTWSNTTVDNAVTLCQNAAISYTRLGITRGYMVRHGPGPFPTESAKLTKWRPDDYNNFNEWQREFRVGHLDTVLLDYALQACPVDSLAVTCMDRMLYVDEDYAMMAVGYRLPGTGRIVDSIPFRKDRGEGAVAHQKKTGQVLEMVEPVYIKTEIDLEEPYDFPAAVANELGLPLALTSWGETAEDKTLHEGGEQWRRETELSSAGQS